VVQMGFISRWECHAWADVSGANGFNVSIQFSNCTSIFEVIHAFY
jgi:hypothetical protein